MIWALAIGVLTLCSANMQMVKSQFLEKNVGEAVFLLKNDHNKILKNPSAQKQIAQWLAAFQFDSTLGLFEKNRELLVSAGSETQEIEKNFQLAMEREPYNTKLLTHSIAFWLTQKQFSKAQEKIKWAQQELPYMEIYRVYALELALMEQKPSELELNCASGTLLSEEKEYCELVVLRNLTKESKAKKAPADVLKAFQKTTIPDRHFVIWEKWKNLDEKQKYLSSCRPLSDKQKKAFLMVPNFCKNVAESDDSENDAADNDKEN